MKKILLAAAAMSVVLAANVYASPKPDACPGFSSIQSVGLSDVRRVKYDGQDVWVGFQPLSKYDTKDEWAFAIGPFNDVKADDALKAANASLATLTQVYGPFEADQNGWVCMYSDDQGALMGASITPPRDLPNEMARLMRK